MGPIFYSVLKDFQMSGVAEASLEYALPKVLKDNFRLVMEAKMCFRSLITPYSYLIKIALLLSPGKRIQTNGRNGQHICNLYLLQEI